MALDLILQVPFLTNIQNPEPTYFAAAEMSKHNFPEIPGNWDEVFG
jgi:hypothetical protein